MFLENIDFVFNKIFFFREIGLFFVFLRQFPGKTQFFNYLNGNGVF